MSGYNNLESIPCTFSGLQIHLKSHIQMPGLSFDCHLKALWCEFLQQICQIADPHFLGSYNNNRYDKC